MSDINKEYGIKMDIPTFCKHMMDRMDTWNPLRMFLGDDFAVFEFDFRYQRDNIYDNLVNYMSYYGYKVYIDKVDRLVIVNTYHKI